MANDIAHERAAPKAPSEEAAAVLAEARKLVAEKKKLGWTRNDFVAALKQLFEEDGDESTAATKLVSEPPEVPHGTA